MANVFSQLSITLQKCMETYDYIDPTDIQERSIPLLLRGLNILMIAPTGTGKTEAALFPVFDLFLRKQGELEKGIQILYITPLRALNRDILRRMASMAETLGIKVQVRHGDTTTNERRQQTLHPPNMLILTPETLQAILVGRVLRQHLRATRWVVVDEIHELVDSKRGVQLVFALERLLEITGREFQRIGISATVGSPKQVGHFLVGKSRRVSIIYVPKSKGTEVKVDFVETTPRDAGLARELGVTPAITARMHRIIDEIEAHTTTLVFTNTRELTELLTSRLSMLELKGIAAHHGALSAEERTQTEASLKSRELRGMVCTSSLELGIDIGSVDFIIQYMSPRQATTFLQRIGRSGHTLTGVSHGLILPLTVDDVCESAAIVRRAKEGMLEDIVIHELAYDVLAHQLAGLLLDKAEITFDDILRIAQRSAPYHELTQQEIRAVAGQLQSQGILFIIGERLRRRIPNIYDYYFETLSMIPDTHQYSAIDVTSKKRVGQLDEEFVVVHGKTGQVIILAGKLWRVVGLGEEEIYLEPAEKSEGAIPSWVGELIPVAYGIAQEVGVLRERISQDKPLSKEYSLTEASTAFAKKQLTEHVGSRVPVPTPSRLIIETMKNYAIIHCLGGTKANETLGLLISSAFTARLGAGVRYRADPYRILLTLPYNVKSETLRSELLNLEESKLDFLLESSIERSDIYYWRLQHVARRFGFITRKSDAALVRRILPSLRGTMIHREAIKEIYVDKLNIQACKEIIQSIRKGTTTIEAFDRTQEEGLSPLAQDVLSLVFHSLVAPGRPLKAIYETIRTRLANKNVRLLCVLCARWKGIRIVKSLSDPIRCPLCGSRYIAVTYANDETSEKIIRKKKRGEDLDEEGTRAWKSLRLSSELVATYGTKAIQALAAYGVGPTVAARVLKKHRSTEEEFLKDLFEAEKEFARTRLFWQKP